MVTYGLYWENGKQNGNYYLGLRAWALEFEVEGLGVRV